MSSTAPSPPPEALPPGGCPLGHGGSDSGTAGDAAAAVAARQQQQSTSSLASRSARDGVTTAEMPPSGCGSCPVSKAAAAAIADEAQLNPANAMPPANQQPSPGQRLPLSTDRVASTIPGPQQGTAEEMNGTWLYPSPQMFYNAMRRKGYEPKEEDMRTVVAIHNTVNEQTWLEVLKWERLHPECTDRRKLVRFGGKPDEPTLKARMYGAMGYKSPFDRHDWVVDRCGTEVRYLIDFYHGRPTPRKPVAMHIDARPAADDLTGVWDRLRMPFVQLWRQIGGN